MYTDYDVIVIGSGCAGLTAGIYASRAGFDTVILEKGGVGGEMVSRQLIENYPGFADGVMGPELAHAMLEQAEKAGTEFETAEVVSVKDKGGYKLVKTTEESLTCKGVILAMGSHPRLLGIPGEQELSGRGVFYCATCDGPQCAGKAVAVVGAGDSAVTEALFLERLGCKVTVLARSKPRATKALLDRAEASPNIQILCATEVERICGDTWVTGLELVDKGSGEKRLLEVEGVFIRIGLVPNTQLLEGALNLEAGGQVPVDAHMATALPGVYAAGDIRSGSPEQISTAVGDGAAAAISLCRYLNSL